MRSQAEPGNEFRNKRYDDYFFLAFFPAAFLAVDFLTETLASAFFFTEVFLVSALDSDLEFAFTAGWSAFLAPFFLAAFGFDLDPFFEAESSFFFVALPPKMELHPSAYFSFVPTRRIVMIKSFVKLIVNQYVKLTSMNAFVP